MSTLRFIHTGDIHLDSPLRGLAGQRDATADCIRTATRTAFTNLIDQAIQERVAFVIIAGDLYDGDWRDYQTGLFFVAQMGRLAAASVPVFLAYGNHDAESQITRRLELPENVNVFSADKPHTIELVGHRVSLHGQSFKRPDVSDNLVPNYPSPVNGTFNIGVLHTGLGGMKGHKNYAPCSLEDLVNKGYDYWALAHVHQGEVLHAHPHVVFCGNLQGRHIRESGPKSACLVTIEDGRVEEVSNLEVDVVRWTRISVSVDRTGTVASVTDQVRAAIAKAVADESNGRMLACRIELIGKTELHGHLLSAGEWLLAEAQAAALALGDEAAWIERLIVSTEPAPPEASSSLPQDALYELQQFMEEAALDPNLRSQFEGDIGELLRRLPHEIIGEDQADGILKLANGDDFAGLIDEAAGYVQARLSGRG